MINPEELKKGFISPLMETVDKLNQQLIPKLNQKEKNLLNDKTNELKGLISENDPKKLLKLITNLKNANININNLR